MLVGASAMAMLVGITSCSDYDNGYDDKSLAYKESFIEAFGSIDPNHTWNMAQSCSVDVTVNMPGTFTIKVWTADPRMEGSNSYLIGKYENVSGGGTSTFLCDIPSTVETAYVGAIDEDGNRFVVPASVTNRKVKASIGVQGTRYVVGNTSGTIKVSPAEKWEMKAEDVLRPIERLPEYENNTGKVAQNFEYYSQGPFTIYPMYSITGNTGRDSNYGEQIGIYIVNADGTKSETQWVWQPHPTDNQSPDWLEGYYVNEWGGYWQPITWPLQFFTNLYDKKVFEGSYTRIRTEGITIDIPVGTKFGFVIDASGGGPYYSNSEYNKDEGWPYRGEFSGTDGVKDTYAATFIYEDKLYLAFEDWCYKDPGHDNDFNDVVFGFKDDITRPLIIDKDVDDDPMTYIVACEDLGGSFDWDFNDVVYGIEHVSGQNTARIKLLAAGGTLPVNITYNNQNVTFTSPAGSTCTDLHEAFGVAQDVPVNVGYYQADAVYSHPFYVDANAFSLSTDAQMFKINVKYKDGSEVAEIGVPSHSGVEPQAFLVADPNWKWPLEGIRITDRYGDFEDWVKSMANKQWCSSVWGLQSAGSSSTTDLLTYSGAVVYNGNKATANLPGFAFPATDREYIITILAKADAVLSFSDSNDNPLQVVVDGEVKANQRTFFTLSPEVTQKIRDFDKYGNRCKMVLAFADKVEAMNMLVEWTNTEGDVVESSTLLEPNLTAGEVFMKVGQAEGVVSYNTKSAGACTYESLNTNVVRVDDNGNLTRVAPGKTTVVITQVACGDYKSAIAYAPVIVEGKNRDVKIENGNPSSLTSGKTFTYNYISPDVERNNTVVTSSDPSVATVNLNGDWLTITSVSAGKTKISLTQPAAGDYLASNLEFNLEVIREATAESMYVRGGNATWKSSKLIWTDEYDNILVMFDLADGEISRYSAVEFNVANLNGAPFCVLVMDDNGTNLGEWARLWNSGSRTVPLNVDDTDNKGINTNGRWSQVRKICIAGNSKSGDLLLTNVKLINK